MVELRCNSYSYVFLCFFLALSYAGFLTNLDIDGYVDRINYLSYAKDSILILNRNISNGILTVFANEPLWLLINIFLSQFLSPENTLRVIIFFSSFATFFYVLKNTNSKYFFIILLFLLLPAVLKNNIVHIRQGLGVAFFILGWFSQGKKKRYLLYSCAALIHSSFIIVLLGVIGTNFLLNLNISYGIRNLIFIAACLILGFFGLYFAQVLGARQGSIYQNEDFGGSGLAFIYWSVILGLFLLQDESYIRKNVLPIFFIIMYVCTYFILPVAARIFESVILIVLLRALDFKAIYRYLFIACYILYFLQLWLSRYNQGGFGV
ncbi:EpsG family protein [Pseudoalteromonas sp. SWYJ118]|uniref:EpsG family protein n=1 Tax=Pseudoalteromonas sp. SWYJ118 TaxID=2792062 RepID=UPI0018CF58CF|nr:EpsG family protein [Pseudoalteromonas sp. SWYJ118]MBH0077828.1 EpsG family protein [Pseudoalteromonas sp. SWYJ118]